MELLPKDRVRGQAWEGPGSGRQAQVWAIACVSQGAPGRLDCDPVLEPENKLQASLEGTRRTRPWHQLLERVQRWVCPRQAQWPRAGRAAHALTSSGAPGSGQAHGEAFTSDIACSGHIAESPSPAQRLHLTSRLPSQVCLWLPSLPRLPAARAQEEPRTSPSPPYSCSKENKPKVKTRGPGSSRAP